MVGIMLQYETLAQKIGNFLRITHHLFNFFDFFIITYFTTSFLFTYYAILPIFYAEILILFHQGPILAHFIF